MASAQIDLVIEKGETYRKPFIWKDSTRTPYNLTGYTARMQARPHYSSTTKILDLTDANGGIVITAVDGKVEIYISDTDTSAITATTAVYDLELESASGDVTKLLRGNITFIEEVTK